MKVSWKDVLHYGSGVACLAMAGLTELGVQLPGVTVDPKIAGAAGIGILAAGLKGSPLSGTKAAILVLLGGALLFASQAHAEGTIPNKAAFHHAFMHVAANTTTGKSVTVAKSETSTNACDPQSLFKNLTVVNFLTRLKACGTDDINAVITDANKQNPIDYTALGCMTPLLPLVTAANSGGVLMAFQAYRDARKSSLLTNCLNWVNSTLAPIQ